MSERRDKWDDLYARLTDMIEAWGREPLEATLTEIEEAAGV